jgi:predicted ArsR family transcriptional regulator
VSPPIDSAVGRSRTHSALASASRVRILELLRTSSTALDVTQIAADTALHPNTARFHLNVLVDAGLACCRPDPRGSSGRPRLVYTATRNDPGGRPSGFELLADIFASYLAAGRAIPAGAAEEAGRAFAHQIRRPAHPVAALSVDQTVRVVAAMFAELGFEPEVDRDGSQHRLVLHACPFRAVAIKYPGTVCAMHLGLLKQTLLDLEAPIEAIELEPFVTPHRCVAHLAETSDSRHGH